MIWYIPAERLSDHELKKETKVLVFDETPDVVFDKLLVRPNDKNAQWKANADSLDMSRINELTYVGHITNVLCPAKVSTGRWGFTLSAWHKPSTTYLHAVNDVTVEHLSMQINGQQGVAEQLAHKNRGTLLWVSEADDQKDGALRHAWVMAPVTDMLKGTQEMSYDGSQPAFIEFRVDDPFYGSVPQPLAITSRNYGFAVGKCNKDLVDALADVAVNYPFTG